MPFLRFSLDRRGNEITSLVHQDRRHGKGRSRVLYWFRTPPDIKVGRAAIDEEVIRLLEETHPDLQFDWPRILQAHKARAASDTRATATGPSRSTPAGGRRQPSSRRAAAPDAQVTMAHTREAAGNITVPAQPTALDAAAGIVSHADVARLRGRYAEVLARISQRVSDPVRADALRLEAETLNPDGWVTPEEVREGVASFESIEARLRDVLGRGSRTRRGGARHRRRKGTTDVSGASTSPRPQGEARRDDPTPAREPESPEQ